MGSTIAVFAATAAAVAFIAAVAWPAATAFRGRAVKCRSLRREPGRTEPADAGP